MARKNSKNEIIDKAIGRKIHELRIAKGKSRKQIALLIDVSGAQFEKYEKGSNRITAGRLMAIAKALGVSVNYFFDSVETFEPTHSAHERLGIELSRAFLKIKDPKRQVALVALARTLH